MRTPLGLCLVFISEQGKASLHCFGGDGRYSISAISSLYLDHIRRSDCIISSLVHNDYNTKAFGISYNIPSGNSLSCVNLLFSKISSFHPPGKQINSVLHCNLRALYALSVLPQLPFTRYNTLFQRYLATGNTSTLQFPNIYVCIKFKESSDKTVSNFICDTS